MAKKTRRVKKEKKTSGYNLPLLLIALIAIVLISIYYFQLSKTGNNFQTTETTEQSRTQTIVTSSGGSCSRDNQCFVTHCKDHAKSCVNTTQLTYYSENCDRYIDWIVDQQDPSACACVQNVCTMK